MARRRNKQDEKRIVRTRIGFLLDAADREAQGPDQDLPDRYGHLAQRLARRYQMPLGRYKTRVCRKCGAHARSETRRVRIHRGRLITTCLRCHHTHRRPL